MALLFKDLPLAEREEANFTNDIGVVSQKKNLSLDYLTIGSDGYVTNTREVAECRASVPPSTLLYREALRQREIAKEISAGKDECAILRLKDEEAARSRAREVKDDGSSAPAYIHREPPNVSRPAEWLRKSFNGRHGVMQDEHPMPSESDPVPIAERGIIADTNQGRFLAAVRQCRHAMNQVWRASQATNDREMAEFQAAEAHRQRTEVPDPATGVVPPRHFTPLRYFDKDFFLGSRNTLYPDGTEPTTKVAEPHSLSRLSELYPGVPLLLENTSGVGVSDDNDPDALFNLQQLVPNGVSDSYLAAAVAGVMHGMPHPEEGQGRQQIETLFIAPEIPWTAGEVGEDGLPLCPPTRTERLNEAFAATGCIGVVLYINSAWEWAIVDDIVGVTRGGDHLTFMNLVDVEALGNLQRRTGTFGGPGSGADSVSAAVAVEPPKAHLLSSRFSAIAKKEETRLFKLQQPKELWPLIIEKAYAKLFGSMDAIDGGVAGEALLALTGGLLRRFSVQEPEDPEKVAAAARSKAAKYEFLPQRRQSTVAGVRLPRGGTSVPDRNAAPLQYDVLQDLKEESILLATPRADIATQGLNRAKALKERSAAAYKGTVINFRGTQAARDTATSKAVLYSNLSYVITGTYRNDLTGDAEVELYSPWGPIRPLHDNEESFTMDSCFATFPWEDFIRCFATVDAVQLPDSQHHSVSASTIAPKTHDDPDGSGIIQDPVQAYYYHFTAPLKATITISVEQADPKVWTHLPHSLRRRLPYCNIGLAITGLGVLQDGLAERSGPLKDNTTAAQLPRTAMGARRLANDIHYESPIVYNKSAGITLLLPPGYYLIQPTVAMGAACPFTLRINATSVAVQALWPVGEPPALTGVTTWNIPKTAVEDSDTVMKAVEDALRNSDKVENESFSGTTDFARSQSPMADAGEDVNGMCSGGAFVFSAQRSFDSADLLHRGTLDSRGLERAAFDFFLCQTNFGKVVQNRIEALKREEAAANQRERDAAMGRNLPRSRRSSLTRRRSQSSRQGSLTSSVGDLTERNVAMDRRGFTNLMAESLRAVNSTVSPRSQSPTARLQ